MFLPSLTSPPKAETIGAMGIEFASTEPLNPLFLRTLDQSCVDIRTPSYRTYRAYVRHASGDLMYSPHRLGYSVGISRVIPIVILNLKGKRCVGNTPDN